MPSSSPTRRNGSGWAHDFLILLRLYLEKRRSFRQKNVIYMKKTHPPPLDISTGIAYNKYDRLEKVHPSALFFR